MNFLQLFVLVASLNPTKKTNFILVPDSSIQTIPKNDLACQYYRDTLYQKSGNLAGNHAEEEIVSIIESFEKKDCHNNPTIPTIDKGLINNLRQNLKNDHTITTSVDQNTVSFLQIKLNIIMLHAKNN